jgi:hypothetical protein
MIFPRSEPLVIPPVTNGPTYIAPGRTSSESMTSAGPNSENSTRMVRSALACRPIGPIPPWRRHSMTAMTP